MTLHKLSGGDGYTYLTRQVAASDQSLRRGQSLGQYYTASGEPPGIWAGSGTAALGVAGVVSHQQMQALFGEGLHPDADRLGPIRLGSPPRQYANDTPFKRGYTAAVTSFRAEHGRGATDDERLALRAQVARELLATEDPQLAKDPRAVQEFLGAARRAEHHAVSGFDLVFSPAKSISTLWAVGRPEVRAAISEAHEQAWRESLDFLEREAALTRTGRNGIAQVETQGLVVTAFEHRTSRAGDPDLHTHMAIANRVQGLDGKWRALDARVLHSLTVTASETYNARVEDAVASRLNVAFVDVPRPDGKRPVREIAGVSSELARAFSKRRVMIEPRYTELLRQYRDNHHRDPSRAAQVELLQQATLETREAKGPHKPLAQHVSEWRETATGVLGEDGLEQMLTDVMAATPVVDTRTVDEIARDVLDIVSSERSTWNRWHVRSETERQLRGHPVAPSYRSAAVDQIESLVLSPAHSIRLTLDSPGELPPELARSNGASVFRVHGAAVYTCAAVLDAESRLIAAGREWSGWKAQVPADLLVGLRPGQVQLVQHFATAGTQLAVGVGAAGTGKSHAMAALVKAWSLGDQARVIGLAPSATAAAQLSQDTGAAAQTMARLLTLADAGLLSSTALRPGDMLLVDEAGTASVRDLDRLRALATKRGAVLRLLGDPQQLSAAQGGGAFGLLAHELGAVEMLDVLRFHDPAEAEASLALRAGDNKALEFYFTHGRVHAGTTTDVMDQAYREWTEDRAAGKSSIMMASSNAVVAQLNERAHLERAAAGLLTGPAIELRNDQRAMVGDVILARHNDRQIMVGGRGDPLRNGQLLTVLNSGEDGSLQVQVVGGRAVTTLPADYVTNWVDLGYASTIHRAEGITADRAKVIHSPGMTRQDLYVAVSRGRESNDLYVPVEAHLDLNIERAPDARTEAESVLRAVIARDGTEVAATQTLRDELDAIERLDQLTPEYVHAVEVMSPFDQAAQREVLVDLFGTAQAEEIMADPACDALRTEMAKCSDPFAALASAAAQRELDSAESVAQVLQWRLEGLRGLDGTEDLGGPLPWLPGAPDSPVGPLRDWTTQRATVIADRAAELADRVDREHPSWADVLGDRPDELDSALAWDRAATLSAAYREQFDITDDSSLLGPDRPARGVQARAWLAADDAYRDACPDRPSAQLSDSNLEELAASLTGQQAEITARQVEAQRYIHEHGEDVRAGRGPLVTAAQADVARLQEQAANARARQAARELTEQVRVSAQRLAAAQAHLSTLGVLSHRKRKVATEEIGRLQSEHTTLQAALESARAVVKPEAPATLQHDSPGLAAQMLERAAKADAARLALAQRNVEEAPSAVAGVQGELQQANDELAARTRNPSLSIPVDTEAIEREQDQQELDHALLHPQPTRDQHHVGHGI